jgi:hypothetical protein
MGVLLMLMTISGLIIAGILLVAALATKQRWLMKFTIGGVAVWMVFYVAMLFGFSLTSTERVLAKNEPKEYCGFYFDCHIHTMVTSLSTAQSIGERGAKGTFYIVGIRVFSDARDPGLALHLIEPSATIIMPDGSKLDRDTAAESYLPSGTVQLNADIHSNQTMDKEIVFDVVDRSPDLKLLITEGYGIDKTIEHLLVGDEDSLLHARTLFTLKPQSENKEVR